MTGGGRSGKLDLEDSRQATLYVHGYREGFAFLLGNPGDAAELLVRKLALASGALSLGFGLSDWPAGLEGIRRPVDLFVPDRAFWLPVSLLLAAAGTWVSRPQMRRGSILGWLALHKILTVIAFFGYARLFAHLLPFVFLLQAAACVAIANRLGTRLRRVFAGVAVAVAIALVLEMSVAALRPRNFEATGSVDPGTGKIIQDATVEIRPVR